MANERILFFLPLLEVTHDSKNILLHEKYREPKTNELFYKRRISAVHRN